MKYSDTNLFCCPGCGGNLKFLKIDEFDKDADVSCPHAQKEDARGVREGSIICAHCDSKYPIIKSRYAMRCLIKFFVSAFYSIVRM